jgi:ribonuclease P protein component
MLKKQQRLTTKEFDKFFKIGRRLHGPLLQLIYSPSDDFHGATVVGKKLYKRAVDRNLYRRRLYNVIYKQRQMNNLTGVYIFILKPTAKGASYQELEAAVVDLIGRIGKSR